MVKELDYTTTSHVLESWDALKHTSANYGEKTGSLLFQRLFQLCPEAKPLFGFSIEIDPTSEVILTSKRFLAHGAYLVQMLDGALSMLGPDIELLTEIMVELGSKHSRFGVKPYMYSAMKVSLIEAMTEILTEEIMTPQVRGSWSKVFDALAADMLSADRP